MHKYKALVNEPAHAIVDRWAYEVTSCNDKNSLRFHETGELRGRPVAGRLLM